MASEHALKIANNILVDRAGPDYYKDSSLLAKYLSESLGNTYEQALEIAETIQNDRSGADFYAEANILANYLDG